MWYQSPGRPSNSGTSFTTKQLVLNCIAQVLEFNQRKCLLLFWLWMQKALPIIPCDCVFVCDRWRSLPVPCIKCATLKNSSSWSLEATPPELHSRFQKQLVTRLRNPYPEHSAAFQRQASNCQRRRCTHMSRHPPLVLLASKCHQPGVTTLCSTSTTQRTAVSAL